jgi:phage-related protein
MVRPQSVSGEKPLFWAGSSKDDLMEFPATVKDETALSVAQFGGKHPKVKP